MPNGHGGDLKSWIAQAQHFTLVIWPNQPSPFARRIKLLFERKKSESCIWLLSQLWFIYQIRLVRIFCCTWWGNWVYWRFLTKLTADVPCLLHGFFVSAPDPPICACLSPMAQDFSLWGCEYRQRLGRYCKCVRTPPPDSGIPKTFKLTGVRYERYFHLQCGYPPNFQ